MGTNPSKPGAWPYKQRQRLGRMDQYSEIASKEIEKVMKILDQLPKDERLAVVTTRLYIEMLRREISEALRGVEDEQAKETE